MRTYRKKFLDDGTVDPLYKPRVKKCKPGKKIGKFARGKFIAWDGEGFTRADGRHDYTMLVNSLGDSRINLNGLSTRDCLALLVEVGTAQKNAVHVVFGGGYDVNMMLADCTKAQLEEIWDGKWVTLYGEYVVNYRPRKSFTVRYKPIIRERGRKKPRQHPGIILWDVFGFFQSSFVDALRKYLPACEHTPLIAQRKLERRAFTPAMVDDVLYYCQLECTTLVQLMETLRGYLMAVGLVVSRWDGAGACAAALLKREGIIAHKPHALPKSVQHAAEYAYAGGRTELLKYGHAPNTRVYHYDINSAYPHAMRDCPSLSNGRWQYTRGIDDRFRASDSFSLHYVTWSFADDAIAYPFFWRAYDTAIYYPARGAGWYWWPELAAAQKALDAGVIHGSFTVEHTWDFIPDDTQVKPFDFIAPLFEQRKAMQAAGIGAEKALKLAINSLYGKTAQHLGGTKEKPPRYHCLPWAGYVTSRTRAMLYEALIPALQQGAGIMMATDAIYSLVPLDLPCGDALGEWSYEVHDGITVVQSGVYWTDNDGKDKVFCRGFDKGSLDRSAIVSAWKKRAKEYSAQLTRFVTMGSALMSKDFKKRWRRWITALRVLALSPLHTKRCDVKAWGAKTHNPAYGLIDTQPSIPAAQMVGQIMSAPYPLPWSDAGVTRDTFFDGAPLRIVEQEAYDTLV